LQISLDSAQSYVSVMHTIYKVPNFLWVSLNSGSIINLTMEKIPHTNYDDNSHSCTDYNSLFPTPLNTSISPPFESIAWENYVKAYLIPKLPPFDVNRPNSFVVLSFL